MNAPSNPAAGSETVIEFRNAAYRFAKRPGIAQERELHRAERRNAGPARPQRCGKNHRAETHQSSDRSERWRSLRRRPPNCRVGSHCVAPSYRLRDSGNGSVSALHGRAEYFTCSETRKLASRAHSIADKGIARPRGPRPCTFPSALSARTFRRPATARRRGASARGRSTDSADGRTLRGARSAHAHGDSRRISGPAAAPRQNHRDRYPRYERGSAAWHADRPRRGGRTQRPVFTERFSALQ